MNQVRQVNQVNWFVDVLAEVVMVVVLPAVVGSGVVVVDVVVVIVSYKIKMNK